VGSVKENYMEWYRHGDVTVKPVNQIPEGAVLLNHNIVKHGEATGHAHRVSGESVQCYMHTNMIYVDAPNGGQIDHEEHGLKDLAPNLYIVGGTNEYDHFAEEAREVVD
jgi:hypothetical protein